MICSKEFHSKKKTVSCIRNEKNVDIFNDKSQHKTILSIFNYRETLMTCNNFCLIQTLEFFYINGTYFQHLQTIIEYKIGRGIGLHSGA